MHSRSRAQLHSRPLNGLRAFSRADESRATTSRGPDAPTPLNVGASQFSGGRVKRFTRRFHTPKTPGFDSPVPPPNLARGMSRFEASMASAGTAPADSHKPTEQLREEPCRRGSVIERGERVPQDQARCSSVLRRGAFTSVPLAQLAEHSIPNRAVRRSSRRRHAAVLQKETN